MDQPHDGLIFNVEKAGLNKNSAHQISKKIVETSKDTKYYEKQVQRSQNIDKIVEDMKFKITCTTKAAKIEAENQADQLINILSRKRDLTSTYIHADLDMFYAAVEALEDPSLNDIPFAVGGDVKHGVISTSSYKARQFGVRSGMAVFIALKLCPELKIIPHHGEKYVHFSNIVRTVFKKYDPHFRSAGLDEASLNITEKLQKDPSLTPEIIAQSIQKEVYELTKLTLSIGIAHTTQLAKIASDYNKPNGMFRMPEDPNELIEFIGKLPIRKIPGIGGVAEQTLKGLGVNTVGDILAKKVDLWITQRPLFREFLFSAALGVYQRSMIDMPAKSISKETTIDPTNDKCKLMDIIEKLAKQVCDILQGSGCSCRTVTVKFKDSSFNLTTRCLTFDFDTSKTTDIVNAAFKILFDEMRDKYVKYRLLGVRVSSLTQPGAKRQKTINYYAVKSTNLTNQTPKQTNEEEFHYLSSDSESEVFLSSTDDEEIVYDGIQDSEYDQNSQQVLPPMNLDYIQEEVEAVRKEEKSKKEKLKQKQNKNSISKTGPLCKFLVPTSEIPKYEEKPKISSPIQKDEQKIENQKNEAEIKQKQGPLMKYLTTECDIIKDKSIALQDKSEDKINLIETYKTETKMQKSKSQNKIKTKIKKNKNSNEKASQPSLEEYIKNINE